MNSALHGVQDYYADANIRARMLHFLGGDSPADLTCLYLTAGDTNHPWHRMPQTNTDLPKLWEGGRDIGRSIWDREWLLADLDVEYVNFDFPAEPYLEPERCFKLQRPIEWVIKAVLADYRITPLHLLSGRGHHFVWRIRQGSKAFERLARLGHLSPALQELYSQPHRPDGESVPLKLGAAFAGLGLVMEYVAHRVKEIAAPMSQIPVELTAVEVGPRKRGREMISIDISEYGDPLHTRVIRAPFSLYLKPWQQRDILGWETVDKLPAMFLIPLDGMEARDGLKVRNDAAAVVELARRASVGIPDASKAMLNLYTAYKESSLATFHDWFYSEEHHPPEAWPSNYDLTPSQVLPPCARHILEHPNDLLLRPGGIERIVRVYLALGWHPRHIAGMIRSKFERDYGWGNQWAGYDPSTRADFYTRIFAGLFAVGRDDLVDFNCQSAKEEKLCFSNECPDNLECYKNSLLHRRTYERLARWPINRLFLPEEHL